MPTPNYFKEYFDSLEKQGINLTEGQKRWYMKKYETQGDNMFREYPSTIDEAFMAKSDGFYYAHLINIARAQKRILNIPYNSMLKVHTAWDLGFTDATSIIFFQVSGREVHIIDYIEGTGKPLTEYIKQIKKKDYIYGTHIAPHDIKNHEYSTGKTRFEIAASLGIYFVTAPSVALQDGIDLVHNIFPRLFFHTSDECLLLVRRIENYSKKWDQKLEIWSGNPIHDESSHAADCLRYLCLGLDFCLDSDQGVSQNEADELWRTHGKKL